MVQKSVAAAGLCAWVINIYKYYQIYLIVGPKQQALKNAQEELKSARDHLNYLQQKIKTLEHKFTIIQSEFEDALASKQKCQEEAKKTENIIELAHRLLDGLSNENIRWKDSIQRFVRNYWRI